MGNNRPEQWSVLLLHVWIQIMIILHLLLLGMSTQSSVVLQHSTDPQVRLQCEMRPNKDDVGDSVLLIISARGRLEKSLSQQVIRARSITSLEFPKVKGTLKAAVIASYRDNHDGISCFGLGKDNHINLLWETTSAQGIRVEHRPKSGNPVIFAYRYAHQIGGDKAVKLYGYRDLWEVYEWTGTKIEERGLYVGKDPKQYFAK